MIRDYSPFRCSCGNCSTEFLQNSNECYCCQGLQQCLDALSSELVLEEIGNAPACITLHPGFATVCLNTWSVRLSAGKYQRIDKKAIVKKNQKWHKYIGFSLPKACVPHNLCSSQFPHRFTFHFTFFRSVAYREFIQLICGRLGKVRIPLPACAYHIIRKTFLPKNTSESFRGLKMVFKYLSF